MKLKELTKDDYFTKKSIENPTETQVWIRGDYERSLRKYVCSNFADVNKTCYIKGDREIFTDFIF